MEPCEENPPRLEGRAELKPPAVPPAESLRHNIRSVIALDVYVNVRMMAANKMMG